jgi:hypothetical protein
LFEPEKWWAHSGSFVCGKVRVGYAVATNVCKLVSLAGRSGMLNVKQHQPDLSGGLESLIKRRTGNRGIIVKRWLFPLLVVLTFSGCVARDYQEPAASSVASVQAQVGIVNHTGSYIYSASVNGAGGGNMARWGAGMASICCVAMPRDWYPGLMVTVRWNMPEGSQDRIREKRVEVERYDTPGSVYLHFFPHDALRVVVSNLGPMHPEHPIPPPVKPDA